jgi:hypothetical protein
LTMAVSFTVGVKPHLAVKPFDYSDVPHFVLAHRKTFGYLREGWESVLIRGCPGTSG